MEISLQSAMEYLMTYGWAILAIAIVMVSLYSLGIFNTGNLQPTATPGSCEVIRTAAQTSLAGQCSNLIPKYVGKFNGVNSWVNVGTNVNPTSAFAISAWINTPSTLSYNGIAGNGNYGLYGFIFGVYYGRPELQVSNSLASPTSSVIGGSTLSLGKWTHVVATFDGTKLYIYQNGVATSSPTNSSAPAPSSAAFGIGYGEQGGWHYFNGSIANVQIYNVSLDNSSIKALYQEGIGGAPIDLQHLIGWWPLNGNGNDYSGNNNQGTPTKVTWNANWQSGYSAPTT